MQNSPFFKKNIFSKNSSLTGIIFGMALTLSLGGIGYGIHFLYTGHAFALLLQGDLTKANFYFNRGEYYFNGGAYNLERAEEYFLHSLALSGDDTNPVHYQLGRIHFIKGQVPEAIKEFNIEIERRREYERFPSYKRAYYMRGLSYAYLLRLDQAEADFKKHLEWHPTSWAGHNDLVWIYFLKADYKQAEKYARAGLVHRPNNAWLNNALGTALLNLDKYEEAKKYLLIAQTEFAAMTPERWGQAYSGVSPVIYKAGLEAARKTVVENLDLVETRLRSE